jgi:hypothetical protein
MDNSSSALEGLAGPAARDRATLVMTDLRDVDLGTSICSTTYLTRNHALGEGPPDNAELSPSLGGSS